jgi:hypothetical protein
MTSMSFYTVRQIGNDSVVLSSHVDKKIVKNVSFLILLANASFANKKKIKKCSFYVDIKMKHENILNKINMFHRLQIFGW